MRASSKNRLAQLESVLSAAEDAGLGAFASAEKLATNRLRLLLMRCGPAIDLMRQAVMAKPDEAKSESLYADADREFRNFLRQSGDAEALALYERSQ